MPVYEYECPKCHKKLEIRRSMSEDSSVLCTDCHVIAEQIYSVCQRRYPIKNARASMNGKVVWEA
jgi:putative FmdB family regulatory protein